MAKIGVREDTIAALATPFGEGAVGIVRLSGPQAIKIADEVFFSKSKKPLSVLKTYSLRYGWIVREKQALGKHRPGDLDFKEKIVDEVVVSLMRAPHSYTREDVVEINSHGGPCALSLILEMVLEKGARLAQPGEFTKRAFLNGRIDLSQAEAVLDIIRAKSDLALKNGLSQLHGEVSRCLGELRAFLLEILAHMETEIDFSEDSAQTMGKTEFLSALSDISGKLQSLLDRSFQGKIIREGLNVVIYGKPNVGKSSLLNALLKQERAIVTPIAGTTRDTIEEFINIKGLAVRLIDTAGILEYRDEIEKEAVARTQRTLEESDVVLFVLDGSSPLTEEDRFLAGQIASRKSLVVINKCDRHRHIDLAQARKLFPGPVFEISALKGMNIIQLEEALWRSVFDHAPVSGESVTLSNARHIEILKRSLNHLSLSMNSLKDGLSVEFAALDVKKALEALGELSGQALSEEALDFIFSKFCIGK